MKCLNLSVIISIMYFGLFLSSCEKEEDSSNSMSIDQVATDQDQQIMDAFCNHVESDCDNISLSDSHVSIHTCSGIDKSDFLDYLDMLDIGYRENTPVVEVPDPINPELTIEIPIENVQYYDEKNQPKVESRQRLHSPLQFVKASKISNVKYFIRASISDDCDDGWAGAINSAISQWNNIEGSKVKLTKVTIQNQADIVLGCDTDSDFSGNYKNLVAPVAGYAGSPHPIVRNPGRQVSFRDDYSGTYQLGLAIHEIGHTLGFGHTDDNSAWQMYSSPDTDQNSIMNTILPTTNQFSEEDKIAVRRLWPDKLEHPVDITFKKVGNMVKINLRNPDPNIRPYNHINVGHKYGNTFKWGAWSHRPDANGQYNIYWIKYFGPGTHKFFVQGASHNNEVGSSAIGWFSVEM